MSVDVGVKKDGYFGDAARTFPVGRISDEKRRLLQVTEESLYEGIRQARAGNHLHDISAAVQRHVEAAGFSVVRDLVGHGIGTQSARRAGGTELRDGGDGDGAEGRHDAGDRTDGECRDVRGADG